MTPEECMASGGKVEWKNGPPPVSPALAATMALCVQFFGVYLALVVIKTVNQFAKNKLAKFEAIFAMAANTVNFCPMLCILFIGARIRALEIDPKNPPMQPWAQQCFYLCTGAVLLQTILTILMPLVGAKAVEKE